MSPEYGKTRRDLTRAIQPEVRNSRVHGWWYIPPSFTAVACNATISWRAQWAFRKKRLERAHILCRQERIKLPCWQLTWTLPVLAHQTFQLSFFWVRVATLSWPHESQPEPSSGEMKSLAWTISRTMQVPAGVPSRWSSVHSSDGLLLWNPSPSWASREFCRWSA